MSINTRLSLLLLPGLLFSAGADAAPEARRSLSSANIESFSSVEPVLAELRALKGLSQGRAGLALPSHFAGVDLRGMSPDAAARQLSGDYSLHHVFDDGTELDYYAGFGDSWTNMYARHADWQGGGYSSADLSAYESWGDGWYSSSLNYYEGSQEGTAWSSSGKALWESSWQDYGTGQTFEDARVSFYSSTSDLSHWSYSSEDNAYRQGRTYVYGGGGDTSEDGMTSSWWSSNEVLEGGEFLFACYSSGHNTSQTDPYAYVSEYVDSCYQGQEPFHTYESGSHYEGGEAEDGSWYSHSVQIVTCSQEDGSVSSFGLEQGADGSWSWVDEEGRAVEGPECAWSPWEGEAGIY